MRFAKNFPIRILPEHFEALLLLAQKRQTNASQLARQAIAEFVARHNAELSVDSNDKLNWGGYDK
jgi:predicted transcriptional regulator